MTTTTASRLFATNLYKGQGIRFIDSTGRKIQGTIRSITAPNRRTGLRKITMTDGTITYADNGHTIFSI